MVEGGGEYDKGIVMIVGTFFTWKKSKEQYQDRESLDSSDLIDVN